MMNRRALLRWFTAGVLCGPVIATAQTGKGLRRIGFLSSGKPFTKAELEELLGPLQRLGWVQGRNFVLEQRYASKPELLQPLAAELVALRMELIITEGTAAAIAAKRATATIPIVMRAAGDPVLAGLVDSLPRPGHNVTGYSLAGPEQSRKRVQLLRELLPSVQSVGVLENPSNAYFASTRRLIESAYRSQNIEPIFVQVAEAGSLEDAIARVARQRGQAIDVPADALFDENAAVILGSAMKFRMPALVSGPEPLEAGGLLYHSIDFAERDSRVAAIVDKILHGENPANIPVEQPKRFEIGVNLKTAKTLGIKVPESFQSRADRVIR